MSPWPNASDAGHSSTAVIHRTREPVPSTIRGDLPVTRLERSIVDSWPLLAGPDQRAPASLPWPSDEPQHNAFGTRP
jgi:hypothetical protein